ncbi:MAG: GNAT family N-acetyltransferase [Pseudomonadota bacterium]
MIEIRRAIRDDAGALEDLLRQTDTHYGNAVKSAEDYERVLADILGSGFMEAVIAWADGRPLGYAIYTFLQPTDDAGAQMFMKELFVGDAARGTGLGRALMRHLTEIALARGCLRLDWTTDADNPGAQRLYDRIGAKAMPGRVYYRVAGEEIRAMMVRLSDNERS